MIAKWYISRQLQNEQPLAWDSFKRLIGLAMVGERESVLRKPLITSCSSRLWQCIVFLHIFYWSGFRAVRILQARISLFLYILKYYNLGVFLVFFKQRWIHRGGEGGGVITPSGDARPVSDGVMTG